MKLQLALDRLTWQQCFHVVDETKEYIDLIEVGTGVIKEYGMEIVKEMRELYPKKVIVADMKTCDAGGHEAIQSYEAGADITTVMAFSSDLTITDTLDVSKKYGARVMVDLLEVSSRQRMQELKNLNVEMVSLHLGKDRQKQGAFDTTLFSLVCNLGFEVSVAGGINETTLPDIIKCEPDIVIIGSAITKSPNPKNAAKRVNQMLTSQ